MSQASINVPRLMAHNFAKPGRYRVFKGGRGSGKTMGVASWQCVRAIQHAAAGRTGVMLAAREHLNSLEESSLQEIKQAISAHAWMRPHFDVGEKYIRTRDKRVGFVFAGLRHNLDSIKSKAQILDAWVEEAENVSEAAWAKLLPTVRTAGSEITLTYNPESPDSATHKRFIEGADDQTIITEINWRDNPWFPEVLNQERLRDQRDRPETYDHVWEGAFLTLTDAQIFGGKFDVTEFEPEPSWDGPYQGMDFGFSQDPTAAIRCYVHDGQIWIRNEAGRVKLELDDTSKFITDRIEGFAKYATRADSARPESISYLARHGLPRMESVKKWQGSVEDGIEFIKSFKRVNIHPDCVNTAREFRLYSYKIDRLSGDILPAIVDANNHYIDALRYALVPLMKRRQQAKIDLRF